jgi:hypothetical protein
MSEKVAKVPGATESPIGLLRLSQRSEKCRTTGWAAPSILQGRTAPHIRLRNCAQAFSPSLGQQMVSRNALSSRASTSCGRA